jgi:hypothetical protein
MRLDVEKSGPVGLVAKVLRYALALRTNRRMIDLPVGEAGSER